MRPNRLNTLLTLALLLAGSARIASAQTNVTAADVQRLEDSIDDASRDVAQARNRDSRLASDLEEQLDDARDEAIYLKVKVRRNETVTRSEYSSLRDRVEDIRSQARGDVARGSSPSGTVADSDARANRVGASEDGDIPVGIMTYRYTQLIPERPATPNLDRWYAAISSRPAFKEQIAVVPLS